MQPQLLETSQAQNIINELFILPNNSVTGNNQSKNLDANLFLLLQKKQ